MISFDIISAVAAVATAAAADVNKVEMTCFFQKLYLEKMTLQKIKYETMKKAREKILYIFRMESLQDDMVSFKS